MMPRYIDEEKVLEKIATVVVSDVQGNDYGAADVVFVEDIYSVPTADVVKARRGKWLINTDGYHPYCSECKLEPQGHIMTDFCPNCGADMRGKSAKEGGKW